MEDYKSVNLLAEAAKLYGDICAFSAIQMNEQIFSIEQIKFIQNNLQSYITNKINLPFSARAIDGRVWKAYADNLYDIEKIEDSVFHVGEIIVPDDENKIHKIADCNRVKALRGELDINNTVRRSSNYVGQSNWDRLEECLTWIQNKGYPVDDNYILLYGNEHTVMDGWHRAACLYYLYGNIEIPIRRVHFRKGTRKTNQYIFPYEKIQKGSKVAIYGAGEIGKAYKYQIEKNKFCRLVAWTDTNWEAKEDIFRKMMVSPTELTRIKADYIVVAVQDERSKKEIETILLMLGIDEKRIIQRNVRE